MPDFNFSPQEVAELRRIARALVAAPPPAPDWSSVRTLAAQRDRATYGRHVPAIAAASVVLIGLAGSLLLATFGDRKAALDRATTKSRCAASCPGRQARSAPRGRTVS
jgi:hypothetical protein